MEADEFKGRKAPYAPVSALDEFFEKMQNVSVPARVDQRFLQKLSIAVGNEWALLSALKFLGVVDSQGQPTHAYRLLQSSDRFRDTLRHLVLTAYAPVFDAGGMDMSVDDLSNFFRVTSSPSQAKNAARFFRAVCERAGLDSATTVPAATAVSEPTTEEPRMGESAVPSVPRPSRTPVQGDEIRDVVLRAKAELLRKLPAPHADWSASEYEAICRHFLEMLRHLDA